MTIAAALPITAFAAAPLRDRAVSDESRRLQELISAAWRFPNSVAVGEPRRASQEALDAAYKAAQAENWDGVGSARVEPSTYVHAGQFLRLLPSGIPAPHIAVDTDGEILFEWDHGRRQVFAVSIGRDGTLTLAGLFGHTKTHGTEHLREALPPVASDCLRRLAPFAGS
jgi:hypothetical protein